MNLKDYLAKKGKAPKGVTKDWLHFCTLEITTGSLWAGDPLASPDDGHVVKVPRGKYVVEGIGLADGRDRLVSRLRVRLESAKQVKVGKELGDTGTDSAMIGVCDIRAFDKACRGASDDAMQEAIEAQTRKGFGILAPKKFPGVVMPFVPTGSDGSGPVLALISAGKCVGIELPFMGAEEDNEESQPGFQDVSLLGTDRDNFITRILPDGSEASFWIGGELKAGIPFFLWSDAKPKPVDFRIRQVPGSVLKDWSPMKKERGTHGMHTVAETLPAGDYEFDFRVGEAMFSAVKLHL